jgi:hypothetical protein
MAKRKREVSTEQLKQELRLSVIEANFIRIEELVTEGVNINSTDIGGTNSLHIAARQGELEILLFLEQLGANINNVDYEGDSVLHYAARNNNISIIKYLVEEKGFNLNAQNNDGNTALSLAALYNHIDLVRYLVEQGADINLADRYGNSPLLISIFEGHFAIAYELINREADLNKANHYGDDPLYIVAYKLVTSEDVDTKDEYFDLAFELKEKGAETGNYTYLTREPHINPSKVISDELYTDTSNYLQSSSDDEVGLSYNSLNLNEARQEDTPDFHPDNIDLPLQGHIYSE